MTDRKPSIRVGLTAEKVRAALVLCDGSPTHAAKMLGVGRNTIVYWMRKANLRRVATIEDTAA